MLNRNPHNYFAEVEQIAFSPAHMVPGIEPSPDKMLQVSQPLHELCVLQLIAYLYTCINSTLEYTCSKYYDLIGHSEVSISHRDLQVFHKDLQVFHKDLQDFHRDLHVGVQ